MKAWICLYLCNFQLDFSMTPTENVIDKNVLSKSNIRSAAFTIYGTLAMLCKKKEAVILLVATTNTGTLVYYYIVLCINIPYQPISNP